MLVKKRTDFIKLRQKVELYTVSQKNM